MLNNNKSTHVGDAGDAGGAAGGGGGTGGSFGGFGSDFPSGAVLSKEQFIVEIKNNRDIIMGMARDFPSFTEYEKALLENYLYLIRMNDDKLHQENQALLDSTINLEHYAVGRNKLTVGKLIKGFITQALIKSGTPEHHKYDEFVNTLFVNLLEKYRELIRNRSLVYKHERKNVSESLYHLPGSLFKTMDAESKKALLEEIADKTKEAVTLDDGTNEVVIDDSTTYIFDILETYIRLRAIYPEPRLDLPEDVMKALNLDNIATHSLYSMKELLDKLVITPINYPERTMVAVAERVARARAAAMNAASHAASTPAESVTGDISNVGKYGFTWLYVFTKCIAKNGLNDILYHPIAGLFHEATEGLKQQMDDSVKKSDVITRTMQLMIELSDSVSDEKEIKQKEYFMDVIHAIVRTRQIQDGLEKPDVNHVKEVLRKLIALCGLEGYTPEEIELMKSMPAHVHRDNGTSSNFGGSTNPRAVLKRKNMRRQVVSNGDEPVNGYEVVPSKGHKASLSMYKAKAQKTATTDHKNRRREAELRDPIRVDP